MKRIYEKPLTYVKIDKIAIGLIKGCGLSINLMLFMFFLFDNIGKLFLSCFLGNPNTVRTSIFFSRRYLQEIHFFQLYRALFLKVLRKSKYC